LYRLRGRARVVDAQVRQPHRQGGEVAHPAAFGLDAHAVLGGLVVALAEVGRLALELLIGVGAGVFVIEGLDGDALSTLYEQAEPRRAARKAAPA
jgi:hypothetical protein